ncbi:hypothetical protein JNW90_23515 [Micromonospora sp. STR1s_5]|nr:hypothetical protein [Micromonospora sp. STR1s_5]
MTSLAPSQARRRSGQSLLSSQIENDQELRSYVVRTTILCALAALTLNGANQAAFFIDWPHVLRSSISTVLIATAITVPFARAIGKSNLDLFRTKSLLDHLSRTDPLTGLLNRRALFRRSRRGTLSHGPCHR